jgi:hypothetical protein
MIWRYRTLPFFTLAATIGRCICIASCAKSWKTGLSAERDRDRTPVTANLFFHLFTRFLRIPRSVFCQFFLYVAVAFWHIHGAFRPMTGGVYRIRPPFRVVRSQDRRFAAHIKRLLWGDKMELSQAFCTTHFIRSVRDSDSFDGRLQRYHMAFRPSNIKAIEFSPV